MLSRQEGSMMRHLANAQYVTGPAGGHKKRFFFRLADRSAPTGFAIDHWVECINAIILKI